MRDAKLYVQYDADYLFGESNAPDHIRCEMNKPAAFICACIAGLGLSVLSRSSYGTIVYGRGDFEAGNFHRCVSLTERDARTSPPAPSPSDGEAVGVGGSGFLYKSGRDGVYSVMVLRPQWHRAKMQNYEDDTQITGSGHSRRRTIDQRLRQEATDLVSVA